MKIFTIDIGEHIKYDKRLDSLNEPPLYAVNKILSNDPKDTFYVYRPSIPALHQTYVKYSSFLKSFRPYSRVTTAQWYEFKKEIKKIQYKLDMTKDVKVVLQQLGDNVIFHLYFKHYYHAFLAPNKSIDYEDELERKYKFYKRCKRRDQVDALLVKDKNIIEIPIDVEFIARRYVTEYILQQGYEID